MKTITNIKKAVQVQKTWITLVAIFFMAVTQASAYLSVSPASHNVCNTASNPLIFVTGCVTYTSSPAISGITAGGWVTVPIPTTTVFPTSYTYTINGFGAGGSFCGTTVYTLTVNGVNDFTISSPSPICEGNSTTISISGGSGVNFSWTPAYSVSNASGSIVTAYPLQTTTYTVTGSFGGCTLAKTVTLNVNNKPEIASTLDSTKICNGQFADVTINGATGSTLNWSSLTGVSALGGNSFRLDPTSSIVYTVSATSAAGCTSNSKSINVNVQSLPTVSISATPGTSITSGSSVTLNAAGASNYRWVCDAALSSTSGSSVVATPPSSQSFTVMGWNSNCINDQSIAITVSGSGNWVNATASPSSVCAGSSSNLTATYSGTPSSITWAPATGLNTTSGANVVATPSVTTTYTVTANYGGPSVTNVVTVTVINASFNINQGSAASICFGNSTSITVNNSALTYSISPSANTSWNAGALTYTVTPAATTTYTIIGTNGSCTTTKTFTVTVNTTPTITSDLPTTGVKICATESILCRLNGASTYTWSSAGSVTPKVAGNYSEVTLSPSATTTYTITGSNGSCSSTHTITVTVNAKPTLAIEQNSYTIQTGESIDINTTSNGATFSWTNGNTLNNPTAQNVIATPSVTTVYEVTAYDANDFCATKASVTVNVIPQKVVENSNSVEIITNAYPNPAVDVLNLSLSATQTGTISVSDANGRVVLENNISEVQNYSFDVSSFDSGLYIVKIINENNEVSMTKFIKSQN